jgi:ferritin
MVLSKMLQQSLNDQIRDELASAYLYLAMSAYFEGENLPGFAHWMRIQAQEEVVHAMKIYRFLFDRGTSVVLQALDQPAADFSSPLDVFEQALEHERSITEKFHALYAQAVEEKDYASIPLIEWFITEQVEEEATAEHVMEQLRRVGDAGHALLMLDRELGARQAEAQ